MKSPGSVVGIYLEDAARARWTQPQDPGGLLLQSDGAGGDRGGVAWRHLAGDDGGDRRLHRDADVDPIGEALAGDRGAGALGGRLVGHAAAAAERQAEAVVLGLG